MNSPKKMDILCPHFARCSGCQIDTNVDHLKLLVEARSFFAKHKHPNLQLQTGSPVNWRCRAKLAIRGDAFNPLVGLFEKGTHNVVDIPLCRVHHPAINRAADILREWIRANSIAPYNETTGTGILRYTQMTVEKDSGQVLLVLVINERQGADILAEPIHRLWETHPDLWHSLWINYNTRRDNIIFGDDWKRVCGKEWLWERFCGVDVCFHPASFFQSNPEMFERLIARVRQAVPQGANVAEFYAGTGAIGLALADRCDSIACTEVVPLAKTCFIESLKHLPAGQRGKYSYKTCDAKAALELLAPPVDTVVVDPPRKGLDRTLLKALNDTKSVKTLIYISCGWNSFMGDFEALTAGDWRLHDAEAFLFFPGGEHLEVLAIFKRG